MQRVLVSLFVFVVFAVPPALADPVTILPISITSGSIVVPDGSVASTINLQGTRDFKMSGFFEGLGQFWGKLSSMRAEHVRGSWRVCERTWCDG